MEFIKQIFPLSFTEKKTVGALIINILIQLIVCAIVGVLIGICATIPVIGIIIENSEAVDSVNSILHNYAPYILGRMGIPYREKNINIISIAIDAPQDVISQISGKIGRLPGVSAKTAYSGVITKTEP